MSLAADNVLKAMHHLGWQGGTVWQVVEASGLTVNEIHHSPNIIHSIEERKGINLPARFEHDCDRCEFLGQYREYDLYFCPSEPTIICRFSSHGHEYKSGLVFALTVDYSPSPEYVECLKRALLSRDNHEAVIHYIATRRHRYLNNLNSILKEAGYEVL